MMADRHNTAVEVTMFFNGPVLCVQRTIWRSGKNQSLASHPPAVCAVLELGEAEEHLLQRYLADTVVFDTVFLFGCLQSAKHLSGTSGRRTAVNDPSFLEPQDMTSDIFEKVLIKSAADKQVTTS